MKHKIFLFSIIVLIAIGSVALADYVEPESGKNPGNSNTPTVLKTGPDTAVRMFEKIGTGNGTFDADQANRLRIGAFSKMGLYTDKLTSIGGAIISDNLIVSSAKSGVRFDQYTYDSTKLIKYTDPNTQQEIEAKPLEAFLTGRFVTSGLLITDDKNATSKYDLELKPSSTFTPTTNIGLGNSCNLYPKDLHTDINYYPGGCPEGSDGVTSSYMSWYKAPTFSGTVSSTNNTNNQVVGICTYFKPSTNPTNIGGCYGDPNENYLKPVVKQEMVNHQCIYNISVNITTAFYNNNIPYYYSNNFWLKNPKIGIAWVSGSKTPDITTTPQSPPFSVGNGLGTVYGNPPNQNVEYCKYNSPKSKWKAYLIDDYGQYYEKEFEI